MKLYQTLLHAYPASFRAEYGEEMTAVFARRRRDANWAAAVWLWIETVIDILWNAALVHLDILGQDLRYAARTLGRAPGFTITAIVVAALGVGATTAAFTMVNHVLLRPFPFAQQERLVNLYEDHGRNGNQWDIAPANFRDWKRMSSSFESLAFYHGTVLNLVGQGDPREVAGAALTADMLPTLGVTPMIGRGFSSEDDREGAPGTVLLSYALWQEAFGGDASVLGRKVLLNNEPTTVIGIMHKDFYFPNRTALLWTPVRFGPSYYEDRHDNWVFGIGRLKAGVTIPSVRAEMRTIAAQMQRAYPKDLANVGITLNSLRDDLPGQATMVLKTLFGAALCVLLIACTNLANLLLARAMTRRRELAVRAAMGAGRERLVRQLLTESLILAITGGGLGILIAWMSLPMFVRLIPVYLPVAEVPSLDWRVLVFAAGVTLATGIGFGLIPAMRACRKENADGLRESSRAGGGRRERLRSILVMAEVAGSVVLLVACGLFIRALWRVQAIDPGFHADNVLTMRTSLPMPQYETAALRNHFYDRVVGEAQQLPGVSGAAYITFLPMVMSGGIWSVEVAGQPQDITARMTASMRFVTPGFFAAMGIPLRAGRDVERADTHQAPMVAVVSESFVKRYWPDQDPIGRHFNFGNSDRTVVGVAGEVRVRGLERTSEPQVYMPYQQLDKGDGISLNYAPKSLVVRAVSGNASALAPALRRIIHEADPQLPISDVHLMSEIVDGQTAARRVEAIMLSAFAAIAFLLAAIGIHGLLSFAVSSRTQEIGVRMALGAQGRDILGMILRDGLILALAGIAIGAGLAYGAGIGLQSLLAGVRPGDVTTFAAAIGLCLLMTLAGSLLPAMRAVRIDPATAVRPE
jgi:predicted permease